MDSMKKEVKSIHTLTPMQAGMLYHYLEDRENRAYFEQSLLKIKGTLDIDAFERSFAFIIRRHDCLRTVFVHQSTKKPLQVVYKERKAEIACEDITGHNEAEIQRLLEAKKQENRQRGFDLTRDNLMRICIIKTGAEEYRILWSFHHIIMDGWCLSILARELFTVYNRIIGGLPADDEALTGVLGEAVPYSRYLRWLEQQDNESALQFWGKYLAGYKETATVPQLLRPEERNGYVRSELDIVLDEALTDKLKAVAGENRVTLSSVFHAVWGIILGRYNQTGDVVFGTVVSGRPPEIEGVERILGLFINAIPVRVKTAGQQKFSELLKAVQENATQGKSSEYVALAEIQSRIGLKPGWLDHLVVFQNYPVETAVQEIDPGKSSRFVLAGYEAYEQTNYDFNIIIKPWRRTVIRLSCNRLVYDRETMERIAGHLRTVIETIAGTPEIPIREIPLLTETEKEQVLTTFNRTSEPVPEYQTLHQWVEAQVEKTPDHTAVVYGETRLTYRQLNTKANKLAGTLRKRGVLPDTIVALLCGDPADVVIGMLGILKAGGAYLPLDTDYPDNRIRQILKESGTGLLVTESHLRSRGIAEIEMIDIKEAASGKEENVNPAPINTPDHLAYIIYTSGSTGIPKGVMVTHRGLLNFFQWRNTSYGLTANDKALQPLSPAFDGFGTNLYSALLAGGTLILPEKDRTKDFNHLKQLIRKNAVTHISIVPKLYGGILECAQPDDLQSLRLVVLAAEKPGREILQQQAALGLNIELINEYGPTECTITATALKGMSAEHLSVIGRPIANTQIYILGRNNQVMPIGIPGEICISGAGLARGYLNRPELTAEKFAVHPFAVNQRIYRTGDRGRWLPDGTVELFGRLDNQIKIRGYRVELEEIESVLLMYPPVKAAVVAVKEELTGEPCLYACIVAAEGLAIDQLKRYLAETLPEYMIPAYITVLDQLPLTQSGKVDRNALPEPRMNTLNKGADALPVMDEEESRVTSVWQEVLGREGVYPAKNFFEAGGHSLKAMNLLARVYKQTGVEVPITYFYENPTVKALTAYIHEMEEKKYTAIAPVGMREYYPASWQQKGMYVINQFKEIGINFNIFEAFAIRGNLDKIRLEKVFKALIQRHEALRTSFDILEGELVQRVHAEVDFRIQYMAGSEAEMPDMIKAFIRPFDLSKAPLFRIGLIAAAENRHIFIYDMHHIISDGVSMGILLKEFIRLYEGNELPRLRLQYRDFSAWQAKLFSENRMKHQEEYWLKLFTGEIPLLNLPVDFPRPEQKSLESETVFKAIDSRLSHKLKAMAQQHHATLYMVFLAIFNILLAKYTGQEDIIVGTPVAGRRHADLAGIIGMFVNTLAMRNRPVAGKTFREFLLEVRENTVNAYNNQDYPFQALTEKLQLARKANQGALYDVQFSFENLDFPALSGKQWEFIPYKTGGQRLTCDIFLRAWEWETGLKCCFVYPAALFKRETVKRMAEHLIKVMEQVTGNEKIVLKEIELVEKGRREEITAKVRQNTAAVAALEEVDFNEIL